MLDVLQVVLPDHGVSIAFYNHCFLLLKLLDVVLEQIATLRNIDSLLRIIIGHLVDIRIQFLQSRYLLVCLQCGIGEVV